MKALDVDFAPRRRSGLWRLGCLVLVLGAAVAGHEGWRYWQHFNAHNALVAQNVRLQRLIEEADQPVSRSETPASKETTERAARAVDRLHAPWDALFEGVESAMNGDVVLLSLEPDLPLREVRLRGESRHVDAMLHFVRRVDETLALSTPHLESYELHLQDPQRPVRFSLVARWVVAP
ncbi:hypothetical protein [Acidovorax sp.]|uniref:hypothetical protein n=1 Tax=Acidovorax sp. TaxID=1872122 RepID=UPI0025C07BC1|nr:hypothetical protein [Acidovorax sp.]